MKIIAGSFRNKITYRSVGYDPYAGAVKTGDVKDPAIARLLDAGERAVLYRFANECTVWGDLLNRPVCGFVQSGKEREANNSRPESRTRNRKPL